MRIRKEYIKKLLCLSKTLKEVLHRRILHGRKDGKAGEGRLTLGKGIIAGKTSKLENTGYVSSGQNTKY